MAKKKMPKRAPRDGGCREVSITVHEISVTWKLTKPHQTHDDEGIVMCAIRWMLERKPGFHAEDIRGLQQGLNGVNKDRFWRKLGENFGKFPSDWGSFVIVLEKACRRFSMTGRQFDRRNLKMEPGLPHQKFWDGIKIPEPRHKRDSYLMPEEVNSDGSLEGQSCQSII
jgi:hypothetical protein